MNSYLAQNNTPKMNNIIYPTNDTIQNRNKSPGKIPIKNENKLPPMNQSSINQYYTAKNIQNNKSPNESAYRNAKDLNNSQLSNISIKKNDFAHKNLVIDIVTEPKVYKEQNYQNQINPLSPNHVNNINSPNSNTNFQIPISSTKSDQLTATNLRNSPNTRNYSAQRTGNSHSLLGPRSQDIKSNIENHKSTIQHTDVFLPKFENTKFSTKKNRIIKAYAANTHQGLVRNYNEDRVAIILNIIKPKGHKNNEEWPSCSYFAVYDGHGGTTCADFLRDNLHQYIIKDQNFPWNPKEALKRGFQTAEKNFMDIAENSQPEIDRSGSCAIAVLIVGDMCYVANVGDSRAIMSGQNGNKIFVLSKDHKPLDEDEHKRIIQAGGKIYQSQAQSFLASPTNKPILGPHRVYPGRLSVCRTIGDIEAKLVKYGGNPNVVIAEPEIKQFAITEEHDFIVLASDGIFDKMTSREVIQSVWNISQNHTSKNIHEHSAKGIEQIMREAMIQKTLDNITVVMISFKNFKEVLFPNQEDTSSHLEDQKIQPLDDNEHKKQQISPQNISQDTQLKRPSFRQNKPEITYMSNISSNQQPKAIENDKQSRNKSSELAQKIYQEQKNKLQLVQKHDYYNDIIANNVRKISGYRFKTALLNQKLGYLENKQAQLNSQINFFFIFSSFY